MLHNFVIVLMWILSVAVPSTNPGDTPQRQPVIETSSVKRFWRSMKLALSLRNQYDPKADDALIVPVYGKSGLGKTFAIRGFIDSISARTVTGLPQVITVVVKHRATPKGLVKQILHALGESPRGREYSDIVDEVIDAIQGHDISMFIFDEADRLDEETFECLRALVDETHRPMVLVGLPNILKIIRLHRKFKDRVAFGVPFEVLDTDEFLDVFLPKVVLPRWIYDASNDSDRAMGTFLWERTRPVLRRVRKVLNLASRIVLIDEEKSITQKHIEEALKKILTDDDEDDDENNVTEDEEERPGAHEDESNRRQDAKRKSRPNRKKRT
ncbi:ATP-binding protein [Chloroflexales bacterium ZM16-3]|nr:ATP-binding protein [Chloroflexales bacterium ZM16-3]